MPSGRSASCFMALSIAVCCAGQSAFGQYRVARVASGLNQPNYLTQAPGDPSNIVYITERVSDAGTFSIQGFSKVNQMGKVIRYDMNTGIKTTVLDLSARKVFQDDGLQNIAFHPDFATNGKMYVTTANYTGTQSFGSNGTPGTQPVPTNLVEEFTVNVASPSAATTTLTRTVLNYVNNAGNNHAINWAGFDPTATGDARNYLYISTGDGAFGNNYNSGNIVGGRPSQNPSSSRGKILRVDISGGDSYPTDANKNFLIPASNPIPNYNTLNPSTPITGNGEAWITGMRNAYRMSFDRANGDLYMGDVGENLYEEVDFLKAGTNTGATQGPADFGWPQLEGAHASTISGAPHTSTNPFTGAPAINPIQEYTHTPGSAVIGGYVYRGEIAPLQGKYFYADFAFGTMRMLDFDRDTATGSFTGANGSVSDVTALLNSRIFDPNNPNYTAALAGAAFGLDKVVSFGEDNAGNLYIIDFGGTAGDLSFSNATGEYPAAGAGEIFKFIPSQRGDANNNGVVDSTDFIILVANYGTTNGATWLAGDFDGNGKVNTLDFNYLAANFGAPGGATLGTAVPEPTSASILLSICPLVARHPRVKKVLSNLRT